MQPVERCKRGSLIAVTVFHHSVVWHKIYMAKFGTWNPKLPVSDTVVRAEPESVEGRPRGHWRKLYFWMMAGHKVNVWKELKHINPNTGLPQQTKQVLRYTRGR